MVLKTTTFCNLSRLRADLKISLFNLNLPEFTTILRTPAPDACNFHASRIVLLHSTPLHEFQQQLHQSEKPLRS